MEPISLSLMSLATTGHAVRRLSGAIEEARTREHADCAPSRLDAPQSDLLRGLTGLASEPVAIRRLAPAGADDLTARLARYAALHGLLLTFQVALDALFAPADPAARKVLAGRRVDILLVTPEGAPVVGLDLTPHAGPCHRDRIRQRAFREAGLPLLRVPLDEEWGSLRTRLDELAPEAEAPVDNIFAEVA
ncbi:hypothetical protein JQC91_01955 [Jannaschia sp. Os4]|uniref:hypothetical protein n=1 Tax=Jannaschia sp. Os4 TaxID=2807617 RepID=UPI00193ABD33|nr:hypothetical protein [Jannaschia sp. Os4]MBM2575057.1 hypothetical protein [Jannaschia sp. Os4]